MPAAVPLNKVFLTCFLSRGCHEADLSKRSASEMFAHLLTCLHLTMKQPPRILVVNNFSTVLFCKLVETPFTPCKFAKPFHFPTHLLMCAALVQQLSSQYCICIVVVDLVGFSFCFTDSEKKQWNHKDQPSQSLPFCAFPRSACFTAW